MARVVLKRRWLRIAWVLTLALTLALLAAFARRAYAASNLLYSLEGYPTTGTVVCHPTYENCTIYPQSGIGTNGFAYRNWDDTWWYDPPFSQAQLVYVDTSGTWIDTMTATTYYQQTHPYMHMGDSAYAKALCRNATAYTATNDFTCMTTTP